MKTIERICVVTRVKKDKNELIRIVRTPQGVVMIDKDKNLPGRGAYISRDAKCIAMAKKKNILSKALRCSVDESIYELLEEEI